MKQTSLRFRSLSQTELFAACVVRPQEYLAEGRLGRSAVRALRKEAVDEPAVHTGS